MAEFKKLIYSDVSVLMKLEPIDLQDILDGLRWAKDKSSSSTELQRIDRLYGIFYDAFSKTQEGTSPI